MGATEIETRQDRFLGGKLLLTQPVTGYRAGQDAVLLAASCPAKTHESVLELGCGVGTALLCLGWRTGAPLLGIELDKFAAELARRNASDTGITTRIFTADIFDLPAELRDRNFDHIIVNPPYFNSGTASPNSSRDLARREQEPIARWIDVGLKRLRPGGTITVIHTAERLGEIVCALDSRAGRTEIKPISSRRQKPAHRVLVRATKGHRGGVTLYNPLIIHEGEKHGDQNDDFSAAAKGVLWHGEALKF